MFAQESVMDVQKIKELALANGFSLKEQASGNMDLHPYVYEFANAIEQAAKAQAVPRWISTSDRMPKEGEEVFVHSYGQVRQATRDSSWAGGFKERNCYGWQATYSQSHWMPKNIELPEEYHFYYKNDAKQKAMLEAQEQSHD